MLTVDPSQKRLVWVLMVILISAICVTVYRCSPRTVARSAKAVVTEARTEQTSRPITVRVRNLSRNPFVAPKEYAFAQARCNAAELGLPIPGEPGSTADKPAPSGKLPPIQPMVVTAVPSSSSTGGAPSTKPVFELTATIQDADGLSAVIKSNGSVVRVVNVGDTLEAGYKVRALKPDRAVLSNGEDTIIVKKPQL